jgi:YD repeat-containing protein
MEVSFAFLMFFAIVHSLMPEVPGNTDSYFVNLANTEEIPSVVTTFYVHSGANNNHIHLPDGTQLVLNRGEQHLFTSQFGDVVRCSSVANAYIETTGFSFYNVEASHSFFKGRRFAWTASRGGARFHIYADQDAVITVTESYPMQSDSARKQRGELITLNAGETYNSGTLDSSLKHTYEFMSTGDILIFTNVDYHLVQAGTSSHYIDAVNLAPASTEVVGMCANVCDVSVYGGPGSVFRHCIGDAQPTLMVENGMWARFTIHAQTYANPNAACRFYSSDGTLFNVHTHGDGDGSEATALLPPSFHGMYGSVPGHTEQSTVVFVSAENNPTCTVGGVAYQLTGYAEGNPSHLKVNNVAPNTLIVCDAPVSVVSDDAVEREESNVVLFRMDHGISDEWDLFVDLLPLRDNREHTITVWSGEDYNKVLLPDGSIRMVMAGESTSFTTQTYGSLIRTATTATVHVTDNVQLNMEAAHESSAGRKFSVHTDRGIGGGYIYFYEGATVTFYASEYNNPDSRAEVNSVTQAKGTVYQYACDSQNRVIEIESTGSIIVSQWADNNDMIILEEVSTEWYGVFSQYGRVTTFGGAGNVYQDCFDGTAQQMVTDSNYGTFKYSGPRFFQGGACRIYSSDGTLFNAVSYGDGDGGDSVQFLPLHKMGTSTVVFGTANGVLQEYMAFVGYDTASCSVGDSTIDLENGQTDGITFARITNVVAGTLITCDRPVMILTEERTYHKESNLHMWGMVNAGSTSPTQSPSAPPTYVVDELVEYSMCNAVAYPANGNPSIFDATDEKCIEDPYGIVQAFSTRPHTIHIDIEMAQSPESQILMRTLEEARSGEDVWDWSSEIKIQTASSYGQGSQVDVEHCTDLTATFDGDHSLTLYCNGHFFGKWDHPDIEIDVHAIYASLLGDLCGCVKHIEIWSYELNSAQVAAYVNENFPDELYDDLIGEPSDTCATNPNLCQCRFGSGHGVISMLILDYDISSYQGFTIDSATYVLEEIEDLDYDGPVRVLLLDSTALSWENVEPLMENALKSDWVDKDGSTWEVKITDLVQSCVDDPTIDLSNARFLIQVDPHFGNSVDHAERSHIYIQAHNSGSYMPTEMPSNSPTTPLPTQQPSPLPTTEDPTKQPTNLPTTDSPSQVPSLMPTTEEPTQLPTLSPSTDKPSVVPTVSPTTDDPTQTPSRNPTTEAPTKVPSISPSSEDPTKTPSISPSTENPTKSPSISPSTEDPTKSPSVSPSTEDPTKLPSISPSVVPTLSPTTEDPTQMPSRNPTTEDPTQIPSISPSTEDPTRFPSVSPSTEEPTVAPSEIPTTGPTTSYPSFSPTEMPSNSCDQYVCEDALEARNYVTKDEIYPLTLQFADLLSEDLAQQQQLHELRLENENNKYRISELEADMAHLKQRLQRLEEELFRH